MVKELGGQVMSIVPSEVGKVKAMASEAKFSAMVLSALPIGMFLVVQFVSPDFYGSVWKYDLTHHILYAAAAWMVAGNLLMYRMVNFKI